MTDRTLIVAAFIIGGAILAASLPRSRYALSSGGSNVVWRMDTWSGQIDICAAVYLPSGPLVRCGATIVTPGGPSSTPQDANPGDLQQSAPQLFAPPQSGTPRDQPRIGKRDEVRQGCAQIDRCQEPA